MLENCGHTWGLVIALTTITTMTITMMMMIIILSVQSHLEGVELPEQLVQGGGLCAVQGAGQRGVVQREAGEVRPPVCEKKWQDITVWCSVNLVRCGHFWWVVGLFGTATKHTKAQQGSASQSNPNATVLSRTVWAH